MKFQAALLHLDSAWTTAAPAVAGLEQTRAAVVSKLAVRLVGAAEKVGGGGAEAVVSPAVSGIRPRLTSPPPAHSPAKSPTKETAPAAKKAAAKPAAAKAPPTPTTPTTPVASNTAVKAAVKKVAKARSLPKTPQGAPLRREVRPRVVFNCSRVVSVLSHSPPSPPSPLL